MNLNDDRSPPTGDRLGPDRQPPSPIDRRAGNPRISVVIPVYQGARYVGEAIQSVLDQQFPVHEIVVVDDGSTDDTTAVVASFSTVVLHRQPNTGAGSARNAGIALTTGNLLAFLDHDDLWVPDKLERQVAALLGSPGADFVYGASANFVSPDRADLSGRYASIGHAIAGPLISSLLIWRDAFDRVGPFADDNFAWVSWYLRSLELGLVAAPLSAHVLNRRIHGENMSLATPDARKVFARLLLESVRRRRSPTNT